MHLRKIKYFFKPIKFGRCCYMRTTEGLVAIVACLCHARMAQAFVGGGRIRLRQGAPPGGIGVVPQMAPRGMSLLAGSLRSTPRLSITMQERGGGDPGAPALERFVACLPYVLPLSDTFQVIFSSSSEKVSVHWPAAQWGD